MGQLVVTGAQELFKRINVMAWFLLVVNTYFEFIIAAMLAVFLGVIAAKAAVRVKCLKIYTNDVFNRILVYIFIAAFTFMFCVTYAASRTDPDFSVRQRYQYALRTIKGWFWPTDKLLAKGGLEEAIALDTQWVASPEQIFYVLGNELYSVLTNGKKRALRFSADEDIKQAVFSSNGKWLALKTVKSLSIFSLKADDVQLAHEVSLEGIVSNKMKILIGGIQWSPDSRKICFFVEKVSPVASQTQWFVYDVKAREKRLIPLAARQTVFLRWAQDSKRFYFDQVISRANKADGEYRIKWFEIPLETLKSLFVTEVFSSQMDVADEILAEKKIRIYQEDKRLRFESVQPFFRYAQIISPSGRMLWVNSRLQLCYQSAYGVRYRMFGLFSLDDYLMFPPDGREQDLAIQEMRWTPSEKYVLLRHYTYGLLVLYPIKRQVGVLVEGNVGIFGAYPG